MRWDEDDDDTEIFSSRVMGPVLCKIGNPR